jgi:hypothetical protein
VSASALPSMGECRHRRRVWLAVVGWSFTLFSSVRVLAYLPTILAIHESGDATQHSLWTWGTWLGANLSMACWLYENNGQRANRAVTVNLGNALMCGATLLVILWYRN